MGHARYIGTNQLFEQTLQITSRYTPSLPPNRLWYPQQHHRGVYLCPKYGRFEAIYADIWLILPQIDHTLDINTPRGDDAGSTIIDWEVEMEYISITFAGFAQKVDWSQYIAHVPYGHISLRDLLTSRIHILENPKS